MEEEATANEIHRFAGIYNTHVDPLYDTAPFPSTQIIYGKNKTC
jgi:hypothetical protein